MLGSSLLHMKTESEKTAFDLASNNDMNNILVSLAGNKRKSKANMTTLSNEVVKRSSEEIMDYLFLLLILLGFFSSSNQISKSLQLASKCDDLEKHVNRLSDGSSLKTASLLKLVKIYLS